MNNQNENIVAGADIGGSHITVALVDINKRCLIEGTCIREYINSKGSKNQILSGWLLAFNKSIALYDGEVTKLAFAMPGPFDYENGISLIKGLDKYEAVYGCNVKQYFSESLDLEHGSILFRNDAESFLHGEVFCGAGRNFDKVLGLTLGTGFGSALNHDKITIDLNLGSVPFLNSIADDYFSTRWFVKRFQELTGHYVSDVRDMIRIIEEEDSCGIFEEFTTNLAIFLLPYLQKEQIHKIILGGNISKAHKWFLSGLQSQLANYNLEIEFRLAELNEEASLIGAAATFENFNSVHNVF